MSTRENRVSATAKLAAGLNFQDRGADGSAGLTKDRTPNRHLANCRAYQSANGSGIVSSWRLTQLTL